MVFPLARRGQCAVVYSGYPSVECYKCVTLQKGTWNVHSTLRECVEDKQTIVKRVNRLEGKALVSVRAG